MNTNSRHSSIHTTLSDMRHQATDKDRRTETVLNDGPPLNLLPTRAVRIKFFLLEYSIST